MTVETSWFAIRQRHEFEAANALLAVKMEESNESDVESSTQLLQQFGAKMAAEQISAPNFRASDATSATNPSAVLGGSAPRGHQQYPQTAQSVIGSVEYDAEEGKPGFDEEVPDQEAPKADRNVVTFPKPIKFVEGDPSLTNIPGPCRAMISAYCEREMTAELPCAFSLKRGRSIFHTTSGSKTSFVYLPTKSTLQAAKYQYGSDEQIIVVDGPGLSEPSIITWCNSGAKGIANPSITGFSGVLSHWRIWRGKDTKATPSVIRVYSAAGNDVSTSQRSQISDAISSAKATSGGKVGGEDRMTTTRGMKISTGFHSSDSAEPYRSIRVHTPGRVRRARSAYSRADEER